MIMAGPKKTLIYLLVLFFIESQDNKIYIYNSLFVTLPKNVRVQISVLLKMEKCSCQCTGVLGWCEGRNMLH